MEKRTFTDPLSKVSRQLFRQIFRLLCLLPKKFPYAISISFVLQGGNRKVRQGDFVIFGGAHYEVADTEEEGFFVVA